MTAPAFEFEEPEPIEASGLVRTKCRKCGKPAIAAPEAVPSARCTGCLGSGSVYAAGELPHTVPVGYPNPFGAAYLPKDTPDDDHPEPEYHGSWFYAIGSAMPLPFELPDSVLKLAQGAISLGWEVKLRYSRGCGAHGTTGKPTALSHFLAVAIGRREGTQREAVAVYVKPVKGGTWSWKTVYVWGPDLAPFKTNREDLDLFIENPQGCEVELRERSQARIKAKEALKPCPAKCEKDHDHKRPAAKKKESGG